VSSGQQPPPIGGVTGTVALEGTVQRRRAERKWIYVAIAAIVLTLFAYSLSGA
jgi:hypothetical protein